MMSKLSFFDKLKVLADVVSSSALLSITILLLIASLFYIFITTNKKNAKSSRRTYIVGYLIVTVILITIYSSSLSKMFDYLMNNLFIVIYFPNLAIYFLAIIITNVILLITIFNFRVTKMIKYINTIVYSIINYLLILIINVITTNKLDVFSQSSVYENKQALALIELSSLIFVVWILFLGVYKIIRLYQKNNKNKKISTKPVERKRRNLPNYVKEIEPPIIAKSVSNKKEEEKEKLEEIKKEEERRKLEEFDKLFTLEDYKIMLNILKEQKEKQKQNIEDPIIIGDTEEEKINDLQDLYRSIR